MFRRGFQPVFCSSPKAFVISIRIADPEFGSAAPPTIHASRWLPMMMVSSAFVPLMMPMTSQIGVVLSSMKLVRARVVPDAGPVLYVASKPPVQPSRLIDFPDVPWPSRALRRGNASR
jgi:hypothetical protein